MLDIQWSDVISTIESVSTQLIVLLVALAAAIVMTLLTGKKRISSDARRKFVHAQTWIVAIVVMVASVGSMCFGPLSTMLTLASGSGTLSSETIAQTNQLAEDIESEGIVLLENNGSSLPLKNKRVNVFGWASTGPIYGGTGSGSMNDQYETTSLLDGLANAGFETNAELSDFYTSYREKRPLNNAATQNWSLPEPPASTYSDELVADARNFSDTAIVVLARTGGECFDLPADMSNPGNYRQFGPSEGAVIGPDEESTATAIYQNNSADYDDFKAGEGYLDISQTERDMLELVCENFDNVVVVYNGANAMNLGFLDEYGIDSALWVPPAGQTGFAALGSVLSGDVNPSGRTTDTFVRNFSQAPWYNNFGTFTYDNMDEYAFDSTFAGQDNHVTPSFVNYVEGIYVGYKYYETADDEGAIAYDDVVQYPFGYGLSYTSFKQEMGPVSHVGGKVSFDVTVTNTGSVAGKDAVEVYYNPPYTNGGIEKASVNLVDFDKTRLLEPGESQTISFSIADEDMASYDRTAADGAGAYVLEAGEYVVSVNADSHTVLYEATVNVSETITYSGDQKRSSDEVAAANQFDDIQVDFEVLSRADHFANRESATASPSTYSMSEEHKAAFVNASNYVNENDPSDEMPTTGAKNGIKLYQLYGLDYDDPMWDSLLDELTVEEMSNLVAMAGYGNAAVDSIDKPFQSDVDGPAALNNNFTGVGSIGLPSGVSVANTFNKELARAFGETIGTMAQEMNVTGWYAPAMNTHRTAYAGRNFEYFSEDGVLAGTMAAEQVAGAKSKGVYAFVKHFALNDQETDRVAMLCTWADEQTMREVYLKPFELAVKDGGASAVMSSFNYVGNKYSAGCDELLNGVLRGEWGFDGFVLTDYFGGFGYQIGDQAIRNGNDGMLATIEGANVINDTDQATTVQALRTSSHNILYAAANSWLYADGPVKVETPIWQYIFWGVTGAIAVGLVAAEAISVKRYRKRMAA